MLYSRDGRLCWCCNINVNTQSIRQSISICVVTITPGPELITLSGQIIIGSPHKNHHHWIYHYVIRFLMLRGWVRFNSIFWLMTRWVASWRFLISNEAIADMSGEHGRQGQNEHLTRLSHSTKCCVCGLFVWSQVTPGPDSALAAAVHQG